MAELGNNVKRAFAELAERRYEVKNIKNPLVTYGITPPNYKGNNGQVDFYCCYEVEPLANVPHGKCIPLPIISDRLVNPSLPMTLRLAGCWRTGIAMMISIIIWRDTMS